MPLFLRVSLSCFPGRQHPAPAHFGTVQGVLKLLSTPILTGQDPWAPEGTWL